MTGDTPSTGPMEIRISGIVIDAAFEIRRTLGGPGLLESLYEEALACELKLRGVDVKRQWPVPVVCKGNQLKDDLRLDLLVADRVIVECKAVVLWNPIYKVQALTYLRLTGLKLGLVINFGRTLIRDGIYRVVNRF